MADSTKNAGSPAKSPKKGSKKESRIATFFGGVKTEFKKIVWPTKERLWQETLTVMIISVILGGFIRLWDLLCQYLVDFIK